MPIVGNKYASDPGDYDESYGRLEDSPDMGRFTDDFDVRRYWVVKLVFLKDKRSNGTGFLLNLPGASKDVVLTAGHNLRGIRELEVHIAVPLPQPGTGYDVTTVNVDLQAQDPAIWICPEFEHNPNVSENPSQMIHDWGMILLPKTNTPGFGFNLRLAFQELGKGFRAFEKAMDKVVENSQQPSMHITTFRNGDQPGKPLERSGLLKVLGRLQKDQLEYGIDTEEGMSGSPIWMVSRGFECVVAIHNYGKASGQGRGSRGTRLNEHVLRQIFDWTKTGYMSRALRAYSPKAPQSGIYLQFHENDAEAWLSIGPGSSLTKFDVLPAYASSGKQPKSFPLWALYTKAGAGNGPGKWVIWNLKGELAQLEDSLTDNGLFQIWPKPSDKGFKIVFSRENALGQKPDSGAVKTELYELTVDASMITDDDIARGDAKVQGFMQFGRHAKGRKLEYNQFLLE